MLRRLLRSRKLVIWLLSAIVGFSVVATLVPQGQPDSPQVVAWAAAHPGLERLAAPAGLHAAFGSPVFLILVGVLALATAVCAAERTSRARRTFLESKRLTDGDVERARRSADISITPAKGDDPGPVLEVIAATATAQRMRVRSGPRVIEANSRRWGAWGSPVFHWALTALMLVLIAGYATRSSGTLDVRVDEPVREAPDAYRSVQTGPLFGGRFTGLTFEAGDLAQSLVIDGVDRGPAPFLTIRRGEQVVASQRVYPNNALTYGSLTVHMGGLGFALTMSVEDSRGVQIGRVPFFLEYPSEPSGTIRPAELTFADGSRMPIMDARVTVPLSLGADGRPKIGAPDLVPAIVETSAPGSARWGAPVTLKVGEAIPLPGGGGAWTRFVSMDDAVVLSVANDWSVPVIYVLFAVAVTGLGVALLVQPRRIIAIADETDGVTVVRVRVDARREPDFRRGVVESLRAALDRGGGVIGPGDADV